MGMGMGLGGLDSVEVCALVGLFLLNRIEDVITQELQGLGSYRLFRKDSKPHIYIHKNSNKEVFEPQYTIQMAA